MPPAIAKGGAEVNLAEDGDGTLLRYQAKADVGGKLAQIGSRLIQGTAKKMADDFFGKFSAIVAERYAAEKPGEPRHPCRRAPETAPAAAGMAAATTGVPSSPPPAAPRQVAFQPERPPPVTAPKVPAADGEVGSALVRLADRRDHPGHRSVLAIPVGANGALD